MPSRYWMIRAVVLMLGVLCALKLLECIYCTFNSQAYYVLGAYGPVIMTFVMNIVCCVAFGLMAICSFNLRLRRTFKVSAFFALASVALVIGCFVLYHSRYWDGLRWWLLFLRISFLPAVSMLWIVPLYLTCQYSLRKWVAQASTESGPAQA